MSAIADCWVVTWVFQPERSWLNDNAPVNMDAVFVVDERSHLATLLLKETAPLNMEVVYSVDERSQLVTLPLKAVAP